MYLAFSGSLSGAVVVTPTPPPSPTPEPTPTPTPAPSPTPAPTSEPTPTPAPTSTPTPEPTPPPLSDFILEAQPRELIAEPGETVETDISAIFEGVCQGPITLSIDEVHQTIQTTFKRPTLTSGRPQTEMEIQVGDQTPEQRYILTVTGTGCDQVKSVDVVLTVGPSQIRIIKRQSQSSIQPGAEQIYTLSISNNGRVKASGEVRATGIVVTDTLDPHLTYIGDTSGAAHTVNGRTHSWYFKRQLDPGQSFSFNITTRMADDIMAGASIVNSAFLDTDQLKEPLESNRVKASSSYIPVESTDLRVTKRVSRRNARIGKILMYRVDIENIGRGAIFNLQLEDRLPNGFMLVKDKVLKDGHRFENPRGKRRLHWDLGLLKGGESIRLRYQVVVGTNARRGRNINIATAKGVDGGGAQVAAEARAAVTLGDAGILELGQIKALVFLDHNKDRVFNAGDEKLPGVGLVMADGEKRRSDEKGEAVFEEIRPGYQVVALDQRTLPDNMKLVGESSQLLNVLEAEFAEVAFPVWQPPQKSVVETSEPEAEATPIPPVTEPRPEFTSLAPSIAPTQEPPAPRSIILISPAHGCGPEKLPFVPPPEEYCEYTVRPGDALSAIAARYTDSAANYSKIKNFNKLESDALRVGQVLRIPKTLLTEAFQTCEFEPLTGSAAGHVYYDINANGKLDKGIDKPIPGVTVNIRSDIKTTVTDENGYYRFDNMEPGAHVVWIDPQTLPEPYRPLENQPIKKIVVQPGGVAASAVADFIVLKAAIYEQGVVEGVVCLDLNGNGDCEPDEPGIVGVTVYDPPALTVEVHQIDPGTDNTGIDNCIDASFEVTVCNQGDQEAVNINITNDMPSGFTPDAAQTATIASIAAPVAPASEVCATEQFTYAATCDAVSGDNTTTVTFEDSGGTSYPEINYVRPYTVLPGAITLTKVATHVQDGETGVVTELSPYTSEPEAELGDEITWRITVESSGLGAVKNIEISETLGAGLTFSSGSGGGPYDENYTDALNPDLSDLADLAKDATVDIYVKTTVDGCKELTNDVEANWGCTLGTGCRDAVSASTSVDLQRETPLLQYIPPDFTVNVPYCSGSAVTETVSFVIQNVGGADASNVTLGVDFGSELTITNVSSPASASYNSGANQFENIGTIPAGGSVTLEFDVTFDVPADWCSGVGESILNGDLIWEPDYTDPCDIHFYPPLESSSYTVDFSASPKPTIDITKSCTVDGVPMGLITPLTDEEQDVSCEITVDYDFPASCGAGSDFTVTDSYPERWTAVAMPPTQPLNYTIDTGAHEITWDIASGDLADSGTYTYQQDFTIPAMDSTICPDCGNEWANSVEISGDDCCACTLQSDAEVRTTVDCPSPELGIGSSRSVPGGTEVCDSGNLMTFTSTYTFTGAGWDSLDWASNVRFTEEMANHLELVGVPTVTVTQACTPVWSHDTSSGDLVIDFTGNGDCGSIGENTQLEIQYELRPTTDSEPQCGDSYSFVDFATLEVFDTTGVNFGDYCPGAGGGIVVRDADEIEVLGSAMEVDISGLPPIVGPCGEYSPTITVTRTSSEDAYDVVLFMSDENYEKISVTGANPTPSNGNEGQAAVIGGVNGYVWNYDDWFSGGNTTATIDLEVQGRCLENSDLQVILGYNDLCDDGTPADLDPTTRSCQATDSDSGIVRPPDISITKFPEVIYAEAIEGQTDYQPAVWTIKVVNAGAGSAYNVDLRDYLGADLSYDSSVWDDPTGITETVISPQEVHYIIEEIPPGQSRTLTLTADITGCEETTNEVEARIGCQGENCCADPAIDPTDPTEICDKESSEVRFPPTDLVATIDFVNPGNSCDTKAVTLSARNAGLTPVSEIDLFQTIPPGLEYVDNSWEYRIYDAGTGTYSPDWTSGGTVEPPGGATSTYIWEYNAGALPTSLTDELTLLAPGNIIEIRLDLWIGCDFDPGQLKFWAEFDECGATGREETTQSIFSVIPNKPILTITKTPADSEITCDSTVVWELTITNTAAGTAGQPIPADYVWIKDEWGSGFDDASVTITPTGGTPALENFSKAGNVATWEYTGGLAPSASLTYEIRATFPTASCGNDLYNNAMARTGCYDAGIPQCFICDEAGTGGSLPDCPETTANVTNEEPELDITLVTDTLQACAENVPIQIRLENTSTVAPVEDLDLDITLPTGVSFIAGSAEVTPPGGSAGSVTPDTGTPGHLIFYDSDYAANNLPDMQPGEVTLIEFEVNIECVSSGNFFATPQFRDCCDVDPAQGQSTLNTTWEYPELRVNISNSGGPYECGEDIEWTIDVYNDGPIDAEMVRVVNTVGSGMNFPNGGASPNGSDFYLTSAGAGSGQPTFDWNALAPRGITWEIADLPGAGGTCADGASCHRQYTLWTRIDSGDCDADPERTNTVEATWYCEDPLDPADEDPSTNEAVCSGGSDSNSLAANVTPTASASATVSPTTVPQCAINTEVFVDITVPSTSNTVYNLEAEITLPSGLAFHNTGDASNLEVSLQSGSAGNLAAPAVGNFPANGATVITFDSISTLGLLADTVDPDPTTIRIKLDVSSSCFPGGDIGVELDFEDCCGNSHSSDSTTPISNGVPQLDVSVVPSGDVDCGGQIDYDITVTNTGNSIATYGIIEAQLGEWFTFDSATAPVFSGVIDPDYPAPPFTRDSSVPSCYTTGSFPTGCAACASGSSGTVRWELTNLVPTETWSTTLTVQFDYPGTDDCSDALRQITVSAQSDCPANTTSWTFTDDACDYDGSGTCVQTGGSYTDENEIAELQVVSATPTLSCDDGGAAGDVAVEIRNNGDGDTLANFDITVTEPTLGAWSKTITYTGTLNAGATDNTVIIPLDNLPFTDCDACQEFNFDVEIDSGATICECDETNNEIDVPAYEPCASLGNYVWHDVNGDGVQEGAPEDGIPGVDVILYHPGTDGTPGTADDVQVATDTTDASGEYYFENLLPGDYFVKFDTSSPALTDFIPTQQYTTGEGTTDNSDAEPDSTSPQYGMTPVTTLTDGEDDDTWDAGFFKPVSIGNYVWFDRNADGSFDSDGDGTPDMGEFAISGVAVALEFWDGSAWGSATHVDGSPVNNETTDSQGYYNFTDLPPGEYRVDIPQSNWTGSGVFSSGTYAGVHGSPGQGGDDGVDDDVSAPTNSANLDDNGNNDGVDATTNGVQSVSIFLYSQNEPEGEDTQDNEAAAGASDSSDLSIDFGFYVPMSLGSVIWQDLNGDGIQNDYDSNNDGTADSPEPGLAGATVELFLTDGITPATYADGSSVGSITTGADGQYRFENLMPGDYVVRVTPPANYVPTIGQNADGTPTDPDDNNNADSNGYTHTDGNIQSYPVTLSYNDEPDDDGDTDKNTNLTVDFGFYQPVSLGNRVWHDVNADGLQGDVADEPGIAGVQVRLLDSEDNPVTADIDGNTFGVGGVLTTDSDGYYNFTNLSPGTYVVEVLPSNWDDDAPLGVVDSGALDQQHGKAMGSPGQGGDDGHTLDDNGDNNVTLPYDGTGAHGGGVRSGEITLTSHGEPTLEDSQETSADNNSDLSIDFGFYYPVRVGDYVWFDANADGIQDATETDVENIKVWVYEYDSSTNTSTLVTQDVDGNTFGTEGDGSVRTDTSGYYEFDNLPPNEAYYVVFDLDTLPEGYAVSPQDQGADDAADSDADVTSGQTATTPILRSNDKDMTLDMGLVRVVSLGDYLWHDVNGDGQQGQNSDSSAPDYEPPMDGWTVELFESGGTTPATDIYGNAVPSQTTGSDGKYFFENLTPGEQYVVRVTPAAGDEDFMPTVGSGADETVTDPDTEDGGGLYITDSNARTVIGESYFQSDPVLLEWNAEPTGDGDTENDPHSNRTVDFGFVKPVSVGNYIWFDQNYNGVQDTGEPAINGVEVKLWKFVNGVWIDTFITVNNLTTPQTHTTTTPNDDSGYYLFDNLFPGTYKVEVVESNWNNDAALGAASDGSRPMAWGTVGYGSTVSETYTATEYADDNGDKNGPTTYADFTSVPGQPNAVQSNAIVLKSAQEPTGEDSADGNNNNSDLSIDFGFFFPSSLGDYVWFDENGDGIQDVVEPGLDNVKVLLFDADGNQVTHDVTNTPFGTVTTDANGYYQFENLPPGEYYVKFDILNSTDVTIGGEATALSPELKNKLVATLRDAGGDDTVDSDALKESEDVYHTHNTTLNWGSHDDTLDGGFYLPVSVGNRVWFDIDADGMQMYDSDGNGTLDAYEPGIEGVTLQLQRLDDDGTTWLDDFTDADGIPMSNVTDTTDVDGHYLFDNLRPGDYRVVVLATNWTTASQPFGANGKYSGAFGSPNSGATTGFSSDVTNTVNIDDNGDNDDGAAVNAGVVSALINLISRDEPVGEDALDGTDSSSELSIDFGFYRHDFGDLPDGYGTELASDGARHALDGETYLGSRVDEELTGVPTDTALGDDNDGRPDDEDGVRFLTPIMPGQPFTIEVTAQSDGYLNAWLDFNGVNGFGDAGEQILANSGTITLDNVSVSNTTNMYLSAGTHTLTFTAPASTDPFATTVYSRFRFTKEANDSGDSPTGLARSGEVEDYALGSLGSRLWRDNGDGTTGGSGNNNGLQDGSEAGLPGATVELYLSSQTPGTDTPIATTTTDASGDYLFTGLPKGEYVVHIPYQNFETGGALENLYSSSDDPLGGPYDGPNNPNSGYAGYGRDHNEDENGIDDDYPYQNGISSMPVALELGAEPTGEVDEPVVDANSDLTVDFGFIRIDFGDLPDSYPTTMAKNAARHVIDDLNYLGEAVDAESDGKPDVRALLDDETLTPPDEDGVKFLTPIMPGEEFQVEVSANVDAGTGYLTIWIDWNGDGDFNDPDEHLTEAVAETFATGATTTTLTFSAPNFTPTDAPTLYSRFRFTTDPAWTPSPEGEAPNGEVEDYALMSLGNLVWEDDGSGGGTPDDGRLNGSEAGIPDVNVELYLAGQTPGVDTPIATTVTDADGRYLFTGLNEGDYFVHIPASEFAGGEPLEDLVSSLDSGAPNSDNDEEADENGVDNDNRATEGISTGVVTLALGDEPTSEDGDPNSNLTIDLGFVQLASLGDYVWMDLNNDGVQDGNEEGIPGVVIQLYDENGNWVAETTTDADGKYLFEDLRPGDYTVQVDVATLPEGVAQTFDADGGLDNQSSLTLGAGEHNPDQDFGYNYNGSIGDTVWLDLDGDGVQDAGEQGIPGVTVYLYDGGGNLIGEAVTDADGKYLFEDLPPGDYTVQVDIATLPPDLAQTYDADGGLDSQSSLTLGPGEQNLDQDFGYQPVQGMIGDRVWLDINANGVQDAGEPGIPGVTVYLYDGNGNLLDTTVTDANGNYLFTNLPPGIYTVVIDINTVPANLLATYDLDGVLDYQTTVTLGAGEINLDLDFGFTDTPIGDAPDLAVAKTVSAATINAGDTVIYTVVVHNNSDVEVANVRVEDDLPDGFAYIEGSSVLNGDAIDDPTGGQTLVWRIDLPAIQSSALQYKARAAADLDNGVYNNVVVLSHQFADEEITAGPASAQVSVLKGSGDCCLTIEKEHVRRPKPPAIIPVDQDIYFITDQAMFATYELDRLSEQLERFLQTDPMLDDMEERLKADYRRVVHQGGRYAHFNLGNVTTQSGLGLDMRLAPDIQAEAVQRQIDPQQVVRDRLTLLAKRAGLKTAPHLHPLVLEYYGGAPYYAEDADKGDWRWSDDDIDQTLTPSAWGMTLLRQGRALPGLLASDDPHQRFIGAVMQWQMNQKVKLIHGQLVRSGADEIAYLPHEFELAEPKDEERDARPEFILKDGDSYMYDQTAMLWGLSEMRRAFKQAGLEIAPELDELMAIVWRALEVLHYDREMGVYHPVHGDASRPANDAKTTPANGGAQGANPAAQVSDPKTRDADPDVITAFDLMMVTLAFDSLSDGVVSTAQAIVAEKRIAEQMRFLKSNMIAEEGGVYAGYNLADKAPVKGVKNLRSQAAAMRMLLAGEEISFLRAVLEEKNEDAAKRIHAFMDAKLWDDRYGLYRDNTHWRVQSDYTPLSVGAVVGALREMSLRLPEKKRLQVWNRLSLFIDRVVGKAELQLDKDRYMAAEDASTFYVEEDVYGAERLPIPVTRRRSSDDRTLVKSKGNLAPVIIRKVSLNMIPPDVREIRKLMESIETRADKEALENASFHSPGIFPSLIKQKRFDTGSGMLASNELENARRYMIRNASVTDNAYLYDPSRMEHFAAVLQEITVANLLRLSYHFEQGTPLKFSQPVVRMAKRQGASRASALSDWLEQAARASGLDAMPDIHEPIYVEYQNGEPARRKDLDRGWMSRRVDHVVSAAGLAQTMNSQLGFIQSHASDPAETREAALKRFLARVMGLQIAARIEFMQRAFDQASERGLEYLPTRMQLVVDTDGQPLDMGFDDPQSTLFSQISLLQALGHLSTLDRAPADLIPNYQSVNQTAENLSRRVLSHIQKEYMDAATHALNARQISALDAGLALVMLGDLYHSLPADSAFKEELKALLKGHAEFVMDAMVRSSGDVVLMHPASEDDALIEDQLASYSAVLLGLVRVFDILDPSAAMPKIMNLYAYMQDNLWDEPLGVYLSRQKHTYLEGSKATRIQYTDLDLGITVSALAELTPLLSDPSERHLAAQRLVEFGDRLLVRRSLATDYQKIAARPEQSPNTEGASAQQEPGILPVSGWNVKSYDPEIVQGVEIFLSDQGKSTGGYLYTYIIRVKNMCPDRTTVNGPLYDLLVKDQLPQGMTYIPGSAALNGQGDFEPRISGLNLLWRIPQLNDAQEAVITFKTLIDPPERGGEYLNRVDVNGWTGGADDDRGRRCEYGDEDELEIDRGRGEIQARVFMDRDENGLFDATEKGLQGIRFKLDETQYATSDKGGLFVFDDLEPGRYRISVDWNSVKPELMPATDMVTTVVIKKGVTTRMKFAFNQYKQVFRRVYDDRNDNGQQDAGEPGVHAVRVHIRDTEHHAYSAEDGYVRIDRVPVGMREDVVISDRQPYQPRAAELNLKLGPWENNRP